MILFLLAGCNLPTARVTSTPDQNAVATEVGKILTSIPTEQLVIPSPAFTETLALPTATQTQQPTATPEPTETQEPTQTQAPTETNTPSLPTATNAITDPRISLGAPTRSDKMDSSDYWFLYEDEHVKIQIANGFMDLTAINPDGWHGWTLSSPSLTDFYLEETAKPGDCDGTDSYGILSRAPDGENGYFYGFSCDGRYIFKKWDGSKFATLVNWTANSAILKGANQTNRLGIMAKGSDFTFYANGVKIGETSDTTYDKGVFGLWVASYKTPNFTVAVDEVDYWNLQ
jgi:hypothetical protein